MNVIDLFGYEDETYRASLWLYNSTQGVYALSRLYTTVEAAEDALTMFSELTLDWTREYIYNGIETYAEKACNEAFNVAVILRVENGVVVSRAPITDGWFPPGDPRRGPQPTHGG